MTPGELVQRAGLSTPTILIDQGEADKFLDRQLKPELFAAACARRPDARAADAARATTHGYYFIESFMADHLAWRREPLNT